MVQLWSGGEGGDVGHFATHMGLCNSTQKSQNDSSPASEDRHDIRFYTLLQFCDEPSFDIGKIREISHYKEVKQPGEYTEVEHLSESVVIRVPRQSTNFCWPKSR